MKRNEAASFSVLIAVIPAMVGGCVLMLGQVIDPVATYLVGVCLGALGSVAGFLGVIKEDAP